MPTNIQNLAAEVSGKAIVPVVQTTTNTGFVNNFDLVRGYTVLRCTNVSLLQITGFQVNGQAPQDGDRVIVEAVGTAPVRVSNDDVVSDVTNRVIHPSVRGQILGLNGSASYIYDVASSRWHLTAVEPGEFIVVPFNANDFSASGSMTWTVEAADVDVYKYQQRGDTVHLILSIDSSTTGGTASTTLNANLPNGFDAATSAITEVMLWTEAGTGSAWTVGVALLVGTQILFRKLNAATNWALVTNNLGIQFMASFEVA